MNKLELETRTDETGSLQVRLPGKQASYRVHVTVEWEDDASSSQAAWPPGWIDATAGSIDDASFVRQPQGTAELRGDLE